jgi:hypothetical protein
MVEKSKTHKDAATMQKLIQRYLAAPTYANAQKLRAYERKHPMSCVLLSRDESRVLADAIHHANRGE